MWLAVGIHFGVTATQGAVLGLPVSGQATRGLLATEVAGPDFLTCGPFGVESSLVVLVPGLALAFVLLRRSQAVPPRWTRSTAESAAPVAAVAAPD